MCDLGAETGGRDDVDAVMWMAEQSLDSGRFHVTELVEFTDIVDERARDEEVEREVNCTALGQSLGERERTLCDVPNVRDQPFIRQVEIPLGRRKPRDGFEVRNTVVGHRGTPGVDNSFPEVGVGDSIQFGKSRLDGLAVVLIVHTHRTSVCGIADWESMANGEANLIGSLSNSTQRVSSLFSAPVLVSIKRPIRITVYQIVE